MAEDPEDSKTLLGWLPPRDESGRNQQHRQQYAPKQEPSPQQQPPPQLGYGSQPAYGGQAQPAYGSQAPGLLQSYSSQPQGYGAPVQPQGYGSPQLYGSPQGHNVPSVYASQPQQGHGPQAIAQVPPQSFGPQGFGMAQGHGAPPSHPSQSFGQAPPQSYGMSPHGYPQHSPPPAPAPQGYPQTPSYPQAPAYASYGQAAAASFPPSAAPSSSDRPIAHATATVGVSDRVRFIRLTYLHLLGAILAFAGLLYLLMTNETLVAKVSLPLVSFAFSGRWNWGIVLAAFMLVSWVADFWASHTTSRGMQYIGLGIYVIAEALIFVPLLAIVAIKTHDILARGGHEPHIMRDAAFTTLAIFGALTASVLISKKDFSWLRSGLVMMSAAAMMLIVLSLVFGFNLGIVFSVAMVVLAAGYILYQTSQVLAHYDPRQHVAAALALFSSVALMFWYVIRIFLRMRQ